MTLDEGIERYKNNAEYERTHGNLQGCLDFRQLVEWLKELKKLREQTKPEKCGDCISRQAAEALFRNAREELMKQDRKEHIKDFNTRDLMLLNAEQLIHLLPSVTPARPQNPERNRPESIKYCEACDHIEMCAWYPTDGCEWLKTDRYNAGYNAAKEEIALSGEYERAYQRGFEAGRKSEWTAVAESEERSDGR